MSPPATILGEESYIPYQTKAKNGILTDPYQNGQTFVNSIKNQYSDDDTLDLLCVGFGPASLAIAIALEDLEDKKISPKVLFFRKKL